MHVNNIIVTEDDIKYTEEILLKKGQVFDESRRRYIKDFSTLDVLAVPGSGKTTLLLAKLLILEKNLPFHDNSGVLVISHTNTAVKEIEGRIKLFCPRLFSYPNFVGTIQSFVNKFLALPFYESCTNRKIQSLDDEKYYSAIKDYYNSMKDFRLKNYIDRKHNPVDILKDIRFNKDTNLVSSINGKEEDFILKSKDSASYKGLKNMKVQLLKQGILHFDDAYYLAWQYMVRYPYIINVLQKRFRYIFVDEMQDMGEHQSELLEHIFSESNIENISFQRLGDNNQSIHNKMKINEKVWTNRDNIHVISGSHRLTKLNAELATRLILDNSKIDGLNSKDTEYKPVLVVYDKNKVECCVIKEYSKYLNKLLKVNNKMDSIIYKVISWRRTHKDKDKIVLSSYCPNHMYLKNNKFSSSLGKNIDYYNTTKTLTGILIDRLNESKVKINDENINKDILLNHLKELDLEGGNFYGEYMLNLYNWFNLLFDGKYDEFYKDFNIYLKKLGQSLKISKKHAELLTIYEEDLALFTDLDINNSEIKVCNECDLLNVSPVVDTVHSVKGETHDVTLFLESFFNSKYESDFLHKVLCGRSIFDVIKENEYRINELEEEITNIESKGQTRGIKSKEKEIKLIKSKIENKKQYAKLVYVALTRSKSVVGYGINRDKYEQYLKNNMNSEEWEVIFVD